MTTYWLLGEESNNSNSNPPTGTGSNSEADHVIYEQLLSKDEEQRKAEVAPTTSTISTGSSSSVRVNKVCPLIISLEASKWAFNPCPPVTHPFLLTDLYSEQQPSHISPLVTLLASTPPGISGLMLTTISTSSAIISVNSDISRWLWWWVCLAFLLLLYVICECTHPFRCWHNHIDICDWHSLCVFVFRISSFSLPPPVLHQTNRIDETLPIR